MSKIAFINGESLFPLLCVSTAFLALDVSPEAWAALLYVVFTIAQRQVGGVTAALGGWGIWDEVEAPVEGVGHGEGVGQLAGPNLCAENGGAKKGSEVWHG